MSSKKRPKRHPHTHTHTVRPVAAAKRKRKITQPHPPLCGNSNFAFHLPAKSTRSIIATGSPATYKAPPPRPPQAKLFTQNRINRCLFDCFFLICGEGGRAVFFGRRSNKKLTKTDHKQRNPPSPSRCCAVCAQPKCHGGKGEKKTKTTRAWGKIKKQRCFITAGQCKNCPAEVMDCMRGAEKHIRNNIHVSSRSHNKEQISW